MPSGVSIASEISFTSRSTPQVPFSRIKMESRRHFGCLGYPCEIALRPRAAETQRLRRSPVEITHVRRQGFVSPVESAWQGRTEHTEVFLRRIDLHRGVDLQKMI